ncbi:MAG TPA: arginase family protein [Gemmatimonadales bacterium]|nr:arginase family protein [Gemmatimonadales bacterium]
MSERRVAPILAGDVPTLFEAPVGGPADGNVVLLGVPYEGVKVRDRHTLLPESAAGAPPDSIYFRTGADLAPDAIRRQSVYYSIEHEGGVAEELGGRPLTDALRLVDAGNHDLGGAEQVAEAAARAGAVTVAMGGDHLVPLPLLRGLQRGRPRRLGLLVLDSHYDLHEAPPLWAGSQWRTAFAEGLLDPRDVILVGMRGVRHSPHERAAAAALGIEVVPLHAIDSQGLEAVRATIARRLAQVDAVYVSLDIDVVDPAFCPAQKYPDAAGLTARETLALLRAGFEAAPVAGFDLCCLAPQYDEGGRGALFAARCALEAVYACARRQD